MKLNMTRHPGQHIGGASSLSGALPEAHGHRDVC